MTGVATDELDGVPLSSLDAPLGDGLGVTKGDLITYLDAVALLFARHRRPQIS